MKIRTCLAAVLCCLILRLPAAALTYVDDFADSAKNNIKSYAGLAYFPMEQGGWATLPDRTAFSFASPSHPAGYALYRAQGAQQVAVGMYSLAGTFVAEVPGAPGSWVLGAPEGDLAVLAGQALRQAEYSPSAGAVYTHVEGALYKAHAGSLFCEFLPTDDSPGDLVGYGVNVYASPGSGEFRRVALSATLRQYRNGSPFLYEELTGTLPADTRLVRVELNDVTRFPLAEQAGYVQKSATRLNCIASVALQGDALALGEPEPLEPEPAPPAGESSAKEPSSRRAAQPQRPAESAGSSAGAGGAAASSSASAPSSKFEGVIVSSGSGRAGAASSARPEPPTPESAPQPDPSAPAQEGAVYTIEPADAQNRYFTAGVTVYIIVVTGALLFVLLRAGTKKK